MTSVYLCIDLSQILYLEQTMLVSSAVTQIAGKKRTCVCKILFSVPNLVWNLIQ